MSTQPVDNVDQSDGSFSGNPIEYLKDGFLKVGTNEPTYLGPHPNALNNEVGHYTQKHGWSPVSPTFVRGHIDRHGAVRVPESEVPEIVATEGEDCPECGSKLFEIEIDGDWFGFGCRDCIIFYCGVDDLELVRKHPATVRSGGEE